MKKIIFLLFALVLTAALKAQDYPLDKDGTTWQYVFTTTTTYACIYNVVDGDTTVNEHTYKKLYSYSTPQYIEGKATFERAFRQEGNQIYALPDKDMEYLPEINGEVLLYDFTLQEGDTFPKSDMGARTFTVKKVDYVEINGGQRKRIWFSDNDKDVWIEGIGSLNRPFAYPLSPTPTNGTAYIQEMFEQDGKVLYGSRRFDLLADGVHWTERTSTLGNTDESGKDIFELQHFSVSGDSLIGGVTYRKVYVNGSAYMNIRQDEDGNIYYYNTALGKEGLLYPFGLQPLGQKELHYTDDSGKDQIIVNDITFTPVALLPDGHRYASYLIEVPLYGSGIHARSQKVYLIHGVGLTQGIFQHILSVPVNCICYNDLVSLYSEKNELVYQNPVFKENGEFVTGISSMQADKKFRVTTQSGEAIFCLTDFSQSSYLSVYGIDGKLLSTQSLKTGNTTVSLPSGTYIYRLQTGNANMEVGKFSVGK